MYYVDFAFNQQNKTTKNSRWKNYTVLNMACACLQNVTKAEVPGDLNRKNDFMKILLNDHL